MSAFHGIDLSFDVRSRLRSWLEGRGEIIPVRADDLSSLLICYSLFCELGGPNDELTRFVYDVKSGDPVAKPDLVGEVGTINGRYCFRIASRAGSKISIANPLLKEITAGHGNALIAFPLEIAGRIAAQGLEPVIVRDWIRRALFSDFAPERMSYRDQLWVLRYNEVLLYSRLVAGGQVIFQDMHDLTAHIAGIGADGYRYASAVAARVHEKLSGYFGPAGRGNLTSHLLPFLIGIIMDGLTQSLIYHSEPRRIAIEELLAALDELNIDPQSRLKLNGFPKGIDIINGLLQNNPGFSVPVLRGEIRALLRECHSLSSRVIEEPATA